MRAMIKISRKQGKLLGILLISIFMTVLMSLGMLIAHRGIPHGFLKMWLNDFLIGCCIAIPAGYVLVPLTEILVDKITEKE
jgi:hypothetical protein